MVLEVSVMDNWSCCFGSMITEDTVIKKDFTSYTREAERRSDQGPNISPVTPVT